MIDTRRVNEENKAVFRKLSQEYELEFSPITKKLPDEHGHFPITEQRAGKYDAWLAYANDEVVGFAVIDISGQTYDMAEFYIMPSYRQCHFGEKLAFIMFDKYKGDWRVRQIIGAEYAKNFWISVISKYTHNSFSSSVDVDEEWGHVYTQRFSTKKPEGKS